MAMLGLSRGGDAWQPQIDDPAAREAEVLEKAKLLVELGVDVNLAGTNGRTAPTFVMICARSGSYKVRIDACADRSVDPRLDG